MIQLAALNFTLAHFHEEKVGLTFNQSSGQGSTIASSLLTSWVLGNATGGGCR